MTPSERLYAAVSGDVPDRVPVVPKIWVDLAAKLTGTSFVDVLEDPLLALRVIVEAGELVEADAVRQFPFPRRRIAREGDTLVEVDAAGRRRGTIDVAGGWATHLDDPGEFAFEDPYTMAYHTAWACFGEPYVKTVEEAHRIAVPTRALYDEDGWGDRQRRVQAEVGGRIALIGDLGSATIAFLVALRGLQTAMIDLVDNPRLVHAILEKGMEIAIERGPGAVRQVVGDRIALMGGVDTLAFIRDQTDEIERQARACIERAGERGGYVLGSGCVVPRSASKDSLLALRRAAELYGRYEGGRLVDVTSVKVGDSAMARNEELFEAVHGGDRKAAVAATEAALAAGADVEELLTDSLIAAMKKVGDEFTCGEAFVPEMLIAARAMQACLDRIEPLLQKAGHAPLGKICIGTVKGDLHDIGKNLVMMMLRGNGYEVEDLGVDCPPDRFRAAVERGARVVCCSALLTTTMPAMKDVVVAVKALDRDVKVVVGGAPLTQKYADQIGADAYGDSASDAARIVERLLGGKRSSP